MTISLVNGSTTLSLCDGVANRGQVGYMIGPTALTPYQHLFDVQVAKPIRAPSSIPYPRANRSGKFGFTVSRLFSCYADAVQWAYYTWPSTMPQSGILSIYPTPAHHSDSVAVLESMTFNVEGIGVDISFAFQLGAITFI